MTLGLLDLLYGWHSITVIQRAPRGQCGDTPPRVGENDEAKILWDFQIQTDKLLMETRAGESACSARCS